MFNNLKVAFNVGLIAIIHLVSTFLYFIFIFIYNFIVYIQENISDCLEIQNFYSFFFFFEF